jgi:hypothetical protein
MTDDEFNLVLSQVFRRINDLEMRMDALDGATTVPDAPIPKKISSTKMQAVKSPQVSLPPKGEILNKVAKALVMPEGDSWNAGEPWGKIGEKK